MGKGSSPAPPAPEIAPPDNSEQISNFQRMIDQMSAAMAAQQEALMEEFAKRNELKLPERPGFDMEDTRERIAGLQRNLVDRATRVRRGRRSTVVTSPLINRKEPDILTPGPA